MEAPPPPQPQKISGDGFTSHIAGLSKSQLYEIMSQMKHLIEQNQQQARQILVENPVLTKALFQAQIMLGMVKPSQVATSNPQPSAPMRTQTEVGRQPPTEAIQSLPSQPVSAAPSQPSVPVRPTTQSSFSAPTSTTQITYQSLGAPQVLSVPTTNPPQTRVYSNIQVLSAATAQNSQIRSISLPPPALQVPILPRISMTSQTPPLHMPGLLQQQQPQPLQPPLPQLPRPPPSSLQHFPHQMHSQLPHNLAFQQSNAPQQLLSQTIFHTGNNSQTAYPMLQPPLPNLPPPQLLYQGGPLLSSEYLGPTAGNAIQIDRGAPWLPGPLERPTGGQLPGPPLTHMQMTPGLGVQQPSRPPPLTPDMEKALLQQVMSLTPEQINLLPPEQRNQVKQLQEMLLVQRNQ